MWVQISVQVWYVSVRVRTRGPPSVLFLGIWAPYFLRQWDLQIQLDCSGQGAPAYLCLCSTGTVSPYQHAPRPKFLYKHRRPDSGPHACMARTSPKEFSSQSPKHPSSIEKPSISRCVTKTNRLGCVALRRCCLGVSTCEQCSLTGLSSRKGPECLAEPCGVCPFHSAGLRPPEVTPGTEDSVCPAFDVPGCGGGGAVHPRV